MSFYRRHGKRWLDVVLTLKALAITLPVMGIVALLIRLQMGRPILFRQQRPGLAGRPFTLVKFRTMVDEGEDLGPEADHRRLTGLGRVLRHTSLDELPELFHVLRGEMSLVGPRPLLREYLSRYTPEQARRHEVRPGLTGWAQVHGRNATTWERRLALDAWYVDHLSFALDMKILLTTVGHVLTARGVQAAGHSTMPEFRGSDDDTGDRP